jgi:HD-GYP domain-containing protein (c-di-GMP phosphodiesterase class II)
MKAKKYSKYSLHITTSTLFITLIIVFGAILSWQNYNKTSEILLASGDRIFDQVNRELMLDFGGIRKSVNQTVNFVALSPISQAGSLVERLKSLQLLSTALLNEPNMSGIQIGYPNGDYFIVRAIRSKDVRNTFSAPDESVFVVDNINTDNKGKRILLRLFYDKQLRELSQDSPVQTTYDPRERPWYKLALDNTQTVSTPPYLFYFFRKVGLTLTTRAPHEGVVVAADVTLDQLSNTLIRDTLTPNTEIVVFEKNGKALIYTDVKRLVIKTIDGFKIARLSQLSSDVLTFLGEDLKLESQSLNFNFKGQTWLGAIREMQIPGGNSFFVLMVSPEQELLSAAIQSRRQSLIMTGFIILITIPIVWLFARKISNPLRHLATEAGLISRFDFSSPVKTHSVIEEVDELAEAMRMMKSTINQFLSLIHSLAGEKNFDSLLQRISRKTMQISQADGALTYLYNEKENSLEPSGLHVGTQDISDIEDIPILSLNDKNDLVNALNKKESSVIELKSKQPSVLNALLGKLETDALTMIALPLRNRQEDIIGILCLLYKSKTETRHNNEQISFVQALSGFAAVSLESRQLIMMQKALLESFIKLIAGAIDSKSPYTGGHCQRVPELTKLIAQAACDSNEAPFRNFQLNDDDWEALHIASWLHDCGKVTTPEYVVDKSTKLETIYDRIHEIRMRVEVLKRDAEIHYWQQIANGGNTDSLRPVLDKELQKLDQDFAFIAECNEGGEFMAPEKIQRLREIAEYTWMRTLDDRIGISWEENQRKQKTPEKSLPVKEKLLADKAEHIIERDKNEQIPENNPWGFHLDVPEYKYNRGELYNLEIGRGTLTNEERFKINDHIVQTIIMLEKLPYPRHLTEIPAIAGSHHEKMDGTGYPRRLTGDMMPLTARIMALADIFEALTASDRPYKKAKSLSEAIRIMSFMVKDKHIDPDVFRLFLKSEGYMEYARKFLKPEQIDEVDMGEFDNL